ncbi:MAG: ATP-dependent DNA helicase RecG [Actinobacteria bacterium]|nr:ATP-dependent DNA helicase RecG [Actinomycetota bacterium]
MPQLASIPVTELRGIGPKHAAALAEAFDIHTVADLLMHYPRRYVDRSNEQRIADLAIGADAMVVATVKRIASRRTRGRPPRTLVTADVTDGSGYLKVTFFNQGWRERQLPEGTECVLFGKVDDFRGRPQMTNPVVDLIGDRTGRIIAMYPQSEKERLTTWDIARWMDEVLERAGTFAEPVPPAVLRRWNLIDRTTAYHDIHRPETMADVQRARSRLVFDELLRMQLALVGHKRRLATEAVGIAHDTSRSDGTLLARFAGSLPFTLTRAQQRVIREIDADLSSPAPMHRLLQGDVGAGKTLVAVHALLAAVQGGYQGALMAPTEVLAEQHLAGVSQLVSHITINDPDSLFGSRPVMVAVLTNRVGVAARREILSGLADGSIDLIVGTHALIQDAVTFAALGVVVIDEQHRFGVEQRAALRDASGGTGVTPDVLVMTATPIPRTAAMTVYGDLDVSVLDELPPGRSPIVTRWARPGTLDEVDAWARVRAEVAAGRQGYVVCPLITESDKLEAASAEATFDRLVADGGELEGLRVGLLHGRLKGPERDAVMDAFRSGRLDVIVATTVIEVGVDVPNATVMVILDADRFGIAQLHQLRGRVGRGAASSSCHLVADATTPDSEARLQALVSSTDGFALAEIDLDLRGEGTLMGTRQTGRNDLRLASLRRDRDWVLRARDVAERLLDADPSLANDPVLAEEVHAMLGVDATESLFKS